MDKVIEDLKSCRNNVFFRELKILKHSISGFEELQFETYLVFVGGSRSLPDDVSSSNQVVPVFVQDLVPIVSSLPPSRAEVFEPDLLWLW